ncbi:conserved hypothetical protein [Sphingomonas aurantiaca]|uniref:Uncharacterized protein n=1 Tax=Sphingomonas aurantiaca TaxID=185949 RepID=A0A5E8AKA8_9SPHN|nr:conserved hypothetical protein [Sphingomonas aurantiaca]
MMPSNFCQAAAVLHTRVAMMEPVGVSDRQIFFSFTGFSAGFALGSGVCAPTARGLSIRAIATKNFKVRLPIFAEGYAKLFSAQECHDG